MIEYESDPVDITVVRDGVTGPASVRWRRHRVTPSGAPTYELEVVGPFGALQATAADLFAALQEVRRDVEPAGWRFAVEGARPRSRALGIHRDQGEGLVVVRLDEPGASRGLFDALDPAESGTVEEQDAAFAETRGGIRTQIIRSRWRSLEPLKSVAGGWTSFEKLPRDLQLGASDPAIGAWAPGWFGAGFLSGTGPGVLAVAPRGTSWEDAVAIVRDSDVGADVPPILLVVDGTIPGPIRRAIARGRLAPPR